MWRPARGQYHEGYGDLSEASTLRHLRHLKPYERCGEQLEPEPRTMRDVEICQRPAPWEMWRSARGQLHERCGDLPEASSMRDVEICQRPAPWEMWRSARGQLHERCGDLSEACNMRGVETAWRASTSRDTLLMARSQIMVIIRTEEEGIRIYQDTKVVLALLSIVIIKQVWLWIKEKIQVL
jgi:hypothetical protein